MGIVEPSSCVCDYIERGCADIGESWNWGWNGADFFAQRPGDSIQSVTWTIPPELTQGSETTLATVFYTLISNDTGISGETYSVFAEMTTTAGEVVLFRIDITLRDITVT